MILSIIYSFIILMKTTVIITGWNREPYFVDAIESVLDQRLAPEHSINPILVVDEDPTDPCGGIAERYLPQVTILRQGKKGTSAARNFGMQHASGDFFAFLDGDDFWHPDKLQKQLDFLTENLDREVVFSHEIGFNGEIPRFALINSMVDPARFRPSANASSFLGRAEVWNLVGPMVESLTAGEFVEWYGRAKLAGIRSHTLDDALVYRRAHESNRSRVVEGVKQEYLKVLKLHLEKKREGEQS